jgi:ferredoxin-NADP reductase
MAREASSWRRLRVARRVQESDNVVSLHLVADDGGELAAWQAGQFLTFKIPTAAGRPVPRNYSLSGEPAERSAYRISVKREGPPPGKPEAPPGIGSAYLHDVALEGTTIDALPPRGDFVLDRASPRPVIFLAGGIGITPLATMARQLARDGGRAGFLFHACESGRFHPLAGELGQLAAASDNLRYISGFANPTAEDRRARRAQFEGFVTADVLRAHLPTAVCDAYLCGPPAFMQAMYTLLVRLGVPEAQIRYEFFGTARKLEAAGPAAALAPLPATAAVDAPAAGAGRAATVTFARSGTSVAWDPAAKSLLELAEAQGLSPAFSCRSGICSTCLTALEGEVTYFEEPLDMPAPGRALICCSVPKGDVRLDI